MGVQQSRSTGGNDETPQVRSKSSNLSERLSATFPRLQKNRGSNAVSASQEADGSARKTGDAAHGEDGSPTPESSAQNAVSFLFYPLPVHVAVYRLDQSLLTCLLLPCRPSDRNPS